MDFVCRHCSARALQIIDVSDDMVRIRCVFCGKESAIERPAEPTTALKPPPAHSLAR